MNDFIKERGYMQGKENPRLGRIDEEYRNYNSYIKKIEKEDEELFILFFEIEKDFRKMYNNRNKE